MSEQSDLLLGGSREWDQGCFIHVCERVYIYMYKKCVCVYFTMLSYKLYGLGMN